MKLGYYPGCSSHGTGREVDESLRAIAGPLGVELEEVKDWACCGATSGHATNHLLSVALPARTLALAEQQGLEQLVAPCAACFSRLATARHEVLASRPLKEQVTTILRRPLEGTARVLSIVEVLRDLAPQIKEASVKPLAGLKIACYYGCLLVRPPEIAGFDDDEDPSSMEAVVQAVGATPVSWNRRLECCGGGFSLSRQSSVVRLGRSILDDARAAGAQAVAVACPMCHSNLDFRQKAMGLSGDQIMPVLYLTQLVGLALGLDPVQLGLERHFVSTRSFVELATANRALEAHREGA